MGFQVKNHLDIDQELPKKKTPRRIDTPTGNRDKETKVGYVSETVQINIYSLGIVQYIVFPKFV